MKAPAVSSVLMLVCAAASVATAQNTKPRPEETEVWKPVPAVVTPGPSDLAPPSDAIKLFDGSDETEWVSAHDHSPAKWVVHDGLLTVNKDRRGQHRNQADVQELPAAYGVENP